MFLLLEGRTGEALSATQALVSRNEPVIQALGHLLASRVLMALNRLEQAIKEGDEAVRQMRSATLGGVLVPQLQMSQGELLLRTGQTERGRAMLRDAVNKLRTDAKPDSWTQTLLRLDQLWRLSHALGDNTLVAELARQMEQHDPAYPGTHYALAKVAEQKGDSQAAEKEYQKAIEGWRAADTDFVSLRDAQRQLVSLRQSSHKKSVSPKRP
jgi:tetratricopeptide (TPR) repeat protein